MGLLVDLREACDLEPGNRQFFAKVTLRGIASRLASSSRNAYARYERGDAVPTVEKLDALLKATSAGGD